MKERLRVSVVIPTYNRTSVLEECLLSIENQSYGDIQIVVSDDSTNNSVGDMIGGLHTTRTIDYYKNPRRLGLPTNRNRGIGHADGDLVMSLDDDTVLDEGCVERLVDTYNELNSAGMMIGALGPALISDTSRKEETTIEDFAARRFMKPRGTPCKRDRLTGLAFMDFSSEFNEPMRVEELHSCSMYPIDILRSIGGYEERLYQGNFICEETDLHARIRRQGYDLFFEPRAIVHHKTISSGGCRTDTVRYAYFYFRNQGIYTLRHNGIRAVYQIPALASFILLSGMRGLLQYRIARQRS